MKIVPLKGHADWMIDEITTGLGADPRTPASLERINDHQYSLALGEPGDMHLFMFQSQRMPSGFRGPGLDVRHTNGVDGEGLFKTFVKGRPGLLQKASTGRWAVSVHVERMDENHYWCRIGNNEITIKRLPTGYSKRPLTIQLVALSEALKSAPNATSESAVA